MNDKPKRKGGPIRFIWHRARSYPIPFSYEVQGSLEHVIHNLQNLRLDLNYFVVEAKPLTSTHQTYQFTFKATDDETIGQVSQTSETTCVLEGTITLRLWLLYASFVMVMVGIASIFMAPKEFCALPILLIGFFGVYSYRPRTNYDYILGLLETVVRTIESTPPVSHLPQIANHPPIPKHSRPTDLEDFDDKEQQKRKRSS